MKGAMALAAALLLATAVQKTRASLGADWVPAGQWCTQTINEGGATITGWACSGSANNCSTGTRTVSSGCSGNNCSGPFTPWQMEGVGCPTQVADDTKCATVLSHGPTATSRPFTKDLNWTTCGLVIPFD
jgi:hypothetical protein